jgi:type VI secretion system secreted protein Hcp
MAIDCFIKIGDIVGGSVDEYHAGSIDVLGWNWGFGYDTHAGGASERRTGAMRMREFHFRKHSDCSSALLYLAIFNNQTFTAKLTLRKSGTQPLEYITIEFKNASIRNVEVMTEGFGEEPVERVSLSFTEMEYIYREQDAGGGEGRGPFMTLWSLPESQM